VLLENNEKWFPAISRANRAVKDARQRAEQQEAAWKAEQAAYEQRLAAVQAERKADLAAEAAVVEGLLEARHRGAAAAEDDVASNSEVAETSAAPDAPASAADEAALKATPATAAASGASVEEAAAEEEEKEQDGGRAEEAEAAAAAAPSSSNRSGAEPEEARKPLFEITPEQIEASTQRRMQELQQELERRKAGAAAPATGGVSQDQ
jgi:hypothetical protein